MEPVGWQPVIRGLFIALIGAAMVGSAIIALSCAYIARWDIVAAAGGASTVTAVAFRRWFRPFVSSLAANIPP
jgi:hypothetical protein